MDTLVISDVHLYMHRRVKILTAVNKENPDETVDDTYNRCTLQYIQETYNEVQKSYPNDDDLEVLFLGDIVDTAYVTEEELQGFKDLLKSIRHPVRIIVGNHDTSSSIPANKLKYSPLRYLETSENLKATKAITIITDTDIRISEDKQTVYLYLAFAQKHKIYDKLVYLFKALKDHINYVVTNEPDPSKASRAIKVILYTHNNIYMTSTLNAKQMYSLHDIYNTLNETLNNEHKHKHKQVKINLVVINGHIHTSYYEYLSENPGVVNTVVNTYVPVQDNTIQIKYLQLGSVSPTSFKTNPIASGIMLYRESRESNESNESSEPRISSTNITDATDTTDVAIYDNRRLVMLSIHDKTMSKYSRSVSLSRLRKVLKVLDDSKEAKCCVFLRFNGFNVSADSIDSIDSIDKVVEQDTTDDTIDTIDTNDTVSKVLQDYSNIKGVVLSELSELSEE